MRSIEERFNRTFAHWGIAPPHGDFEARRRGKIVDPGWAIWYLFGEDERAARYRAACENLGLRVVAHPDGTL